MFEGRKEMEGSFKLAGYFTMDSAWFHENYSTEKPTTTRLAKIEAGLIRDCTIINEADDHHFWTMFFTLFNKPFT